MDSSCSGREREVHVIVDHEEGDVSVAELPQGKHDRQLVTLVPALVAPLDDGGATSKRLLRDE
jgi:hypothetical protein